MGVVSDWGVKGVGVKCEDEGRQGHQRQLRCRNSGKMHFMQGNLRDGEGEACTMYALYRCDVSACMPVAGVWCRSWRESARIFNRRKSFVGASAEAWCSRRLVMMMMWRRWGGT